MNRDATRTGSKARKSYLPEISTFVLTINCVIITLTRWLTTS